MMGVRVRECVCVRANNGAFEASTHLAISANPFLISWSIPLSPFGRNKQLLHVTTNKKRSPASFKSFALNTTQGSVRICVFTAVNAKYLNAPYFWTSIPPLQI